MSVLICQFAFLAHVKRIVRSDAFKYINYQENPNGKTLFFLMRMTLLVISVQDNSYWVYQNIDDTVINGYISFLYCG